MEENQKQIGPVLSDEAIKILREIHIEKLINYCIRLRVEYGLKRLSKEKLLIMVLDKELNFRRRKAKIREVENEG